MSKKVIYKVDIKLDNLGVVEECQCECAARIGPEAHCKHIALVLYAVTKAQDGILTMETCTEVLQTFHQTKKYKGSPVKMEDTTLRAKSAESNSNLSSLKTFDPRPPEMRQQPGYNDFFRGVWLNSTAEKPSIRQLYGPANVYGIVEDHHYCKQSPEDIILESLGVTSTTEEQRCQIEKKTRGQANKTWREERLLRLHASSYGRICMATDHTDFTKLAESLTIHREAGGPAIFHGKKYDASARH